MSSTYPFQIPSGVTLYPEISGAGFLGTATHPFESVHTDQISVLGVPITKTTILTKDDKATGVYQFSGITFASPTTFNVPQVQGWITLNTGPIYALNPLVVQINYSGATGLTTPYRTTADATYLLVDQSSNLVMQSIFPTPEQRRQNIFISRIAHTNKSTFDAIINTVDYTESTMSALRDMFTPPKFLNNGVRISYNGSNLSLNVSSGSIYGVGINWINNPLSPNNIQISGQSPANFIYNTQDGTSTSGTTFIDPTKYDLSGTATSIGVTHPGQSTNQRVFLYPNGNIVIQYGQTVYSSLATALSACPIELFVKSPNNHDTASFVGSISVRQDATDLSNPTQATFSPGTIWGEPGGGAAPDPSAYNSLYTSLLTGGAITQNGTSGVNIAAGSGRFVNNYIDVLNPTVINLSWAEKSGVTISNFATAPRTFLAIDISGNVYQKPTVDFTAEEQRIYCPLGRIGHPNAIMQTIVSHATPGYDSYLNAQDFAGAVGPLNIDGNVFGSYSTNMQVKKSSGHTYYPGVNIQVNKGNPNVYTDSLASPLTNIAYRYRSATPGVFTTVSASGINSSSWDNGSGVLQSLGSSKFTIQRVFYAFGNTIGTERAIIMHGQNEYNSQSAALSAIFSELFTYDSDLSGVTTFRSWLIIKGGTTDLSITANATFVNAGLFGLQTAVGINTATTDLQTSYNNSVTPEITTDATRDGFTMKEGVGVGLNLYEGLDQNSSTVFSVSASGNVNLVGTLTTGNILPNISGIETIGSASLPFNGIYAKTIFLNGTTINPYSGTIVTTSPFTGTTAHTNLFIQVSGAAVVAIPSGLTQYQTIRIKDWYGNASANSKTISGVGNGVTFDGANTYVLNTNYDSVNIFLVSGNSWAIL